MPVPSRCRHTPGPDQQCRPSVFEGQRAASARAVHQRILNVQVSAASASRHGTSRSNSGWPRLSMFAPVLVPVMFTQVHATALVCSNVLVYRA